MNKVIKISGIRVEKTSLVYDTEEVFGRFSNYNLLLGEGALPLIGELEKLSSGPSGVLGIVPGVPHLTSVVTFVLARGESFFKEMAFFERRVSIKENVGELVVHVTHKGLKGIIGLVRRANVCISRGGDFDFRLHPFESNYVSVGSCALTVCGGPDWREKFSDFSRKGSKGVDFPTTGLNYRKMAEKFAPLVLKKHQTNARANP